MMLLMSGRVHCERFARGPGSPKQHAVALPGALLGAATLLCGTGARELYTAASTCHVLAICMHELANVLDASTAAYLDLLFAGSKALAYYIRRFVSLGLNRVWLRAGDVAYKQGEKAGSMYVVISGRLRLVRQRSKGMKRELHVDEEVGRGETIGAVWAVTSGKHDTSAVAVRGCELVRLSRGSFEARTSYALRTLCFCSVPPLSGRQMAPATLALDRYACTVTPFYELLSMRWLQVISRTAPEAAARVLSDMAMRMISAHQSRSRSYKNLRRAATDSTAATGGYVPAPKKMGAMPSGVQARCYISYFSVSAVILTM